MLRKSRSIQGFTLVEIIVSAGLFLFTASILLMVFLNSSLLNHVSRNTSVAINHAEYIIEDITNQDFSSIASFITNGNWNYTSAQLIGLGLTPLSNETTTVTVTGSTLLTVTVVINFNDYQDRSRSETLSTQITKTST